MLCYETLRLDYIDKPKKFKRDLSILRALELEISQVLDWRFHEQTHYDLVVGYLNKGILLPDDKISRTWLDFYAKKVKGRNLSETMQNSLDLSFSDVLPQISGPFGKRI